MSVIAITTSEMGYAADGWGDRCYVKDNSFYVCREGFGHKSTCDGKTYNANKKKHHWYNYGHGNSESLAGTKYYCCRSGKKSGWE